MSDTSPLGWGFAIVEFLGFGAGAAVGGLAADSIANEVWVCGSEFPWFRLAPDDDTYCSTIAEVQPIMTTAWGGVIVAVLAGVLGAALAAAVWGVMNFRERDG